MYSCESLGGESMVSTRTNPKPNFQQSNFRRVLTSPKPAPNTDAVENSARGKFGWQEIEDVPVPFIYRGEETYTATRVLELYVFKKYEGILQPVVYSCVSVNCWLMHSVEVRLFNEINIFHCDQLYGQQPFNCSETVISLQDAIELCKFLTFCINKLKGVDVGPGRCGFYKLNKEAVVPYIFINKEAYLPIFYFEGEVENINHKSMQVSGWDVVYLKFCCKIQQIKESLYNKPSHEVMKLTDIMKHFPAPQTYEYYWPNSVVSQFIIPQRF